MEDRVLMWEYAFSDEYSSCISNLAISFSVRAGDGVAEDKGVVAGVGMMVVVFWGC